MAELNDLSPSSCTIEDHSLRMDHGLRRRVQFTAPGEVDVITEEAPTPGPTDVDVQTRYSAISPGTERLVYEGDVPSGMAADASIDAFDGTDLSYPLSYGYACVGTIKRTGREVDPSWHGTRVFAFRPHVSRFVAPLEEVIPLPDEVEWTDAALIPSVETAVNFVMDGRPMIGEHVLIFGQGIVGLLTTRLLSQHPLGALLTVDPSSPRRERSESLGATSVASVDELQIRDWGNSGQDGDGADLTYELTGRPSVLNDAIQHTGFDGRIIVGSWYGTKTAPIDLGRRFHRSRIDLRSSQVSTIDPSFRGRWTKARRMSLVLDLLDDVNPGALISHRFHVTEASTAYSRLRDPDVLQPLFVYE